MFFIFANDVLKPTPTPTGIPTPATAEGIAAVITGIKPISILNTFNSISNIDVTDNKPVTVFNTLVNNDNISLRNLIAYLATSLTSSSGICPIKLHIGRFFNISITTFFNILYILSNIFLAFLFVPLNKFLGMLFLIFLS